MKNSTQSTANLFHLLDVKNSTWACRFVERQMPRGVWRCRAVVDGGVSRRNNNGRRCL